MKDTLCYTFDTGYADLESVVIKAGTETILVHRNTCVVLVVSASMVVDDEPFIKLVKICDDESEAHDKLVHIIGKMVIKETSSKYFNCPKFEEHLQNGLGGVELSESSRAAIIDMARDVVSKYREKFS